MVFKRTLLRCRAVSIEAFLKGFSEFGPVNQTVLISEQLLDAKSLFLTANTTTLYTSALSEYEGWSIGFAEVPPGGSRTRLTTHGSAW